MQITKTMSFPAEPTRVYEMMLDPAFHELVGEQQEALQQSIEVNNGRVIAKRTFAAHDSIVAFVGKTLEIIEDTEWDSPSHANMALSISDAPVHYVGTQTLTANGAETDATFDGNLTVKIPIIGRSLESQAAKVIDLALNAFHAAGVRYLSK